MNKKTFGILIHLLAIASFFTLFCGFILAVWDLTYPPKATSLATEQKQEAPAPTEEELLLGLGDSLTRGIGDSKGLGYFGRVRQHIEKKNKKVSAVNLAISGQTSTDLVQQLKQPEAHQLIKKARWITMTIGGNDLFRGSGGLEELNISEAASSRETYEKNLTTILTQIRELNPTATVFIFGLYNPFGDLAQQEVSSRLVMEWNQVMHKVAAQHQKVVVIPTFDLFQLEPSKYLYTDHFHPNDDGYQHMATRLIQILSDQQIEVTEDGK